MQKRNSSIQTVRSFINIEISFIFSNKGQSDRIVSAWRDKFGPVEDATNLQIKTTFFVRFHFESFY